MEILFKARTIIVLYQYELLLDIFNHYYFYNLNNHTEKKQKIFFYSRSILVFLIHLLQAIF